MNAEIIGISANAIFSQQAFADFLKLNFPLVSDFPNLKTIEAYGVLNPRAGFANRWTFYIDKTGKIASIDKAVQPATSAEDMMA